ncbi:MAG: DUF2953 domain-containing protein [Lachnospiraceae bacterium]|nr:DUF2953 domain-containing protein [Lachnospiraceae bacterium]
MTIFLSVLKIIGIILLALLCLVLLILIIVLFAPIGYESTGEYDDENKPLINVYAHWLLHIIRFRFTLKGKESEKELKVLFFTLYPKKETAEKPEMDESFDFEEQEDFADNWDQHDFEDTKEQYGSEDTEEADESADNEEPDESADADKAFAEFEEKVNTETTGVKKSVKEKISDLFVKIKRKSTDIYDRIRDGRMKVQDLVEKLSDERTKNAVTELWYVLKRLLWHIRPRRFNLYLHYGMDDPSLTGEIFGIYNSFYLIHMGKPVIVPDFDKRCLDGNYLVRGHIQLFFVLTALIRLYFNKDVKRLYAIIKK